MHIDQSVLDQNVVDTKINKINSRKDHNSISLVMGAKTFSQDIAIAEYINNNSSNRTPSRITDGRANVPTQNGFFGVTAKQSETTLIEE
jgi:hypothetical protein